MDQSESRRRSSKWFVPLLAAMLLATALPASAASESGVQNCASGDHVYTKIRYTDGYSQSYIDANYGTSTKTHQTVWVWVNRYHQPLDGNSANYELREVTSTMSNVYSWPGCEAG